LADEGYIFLAYGLEMEVVGGRSTAFGSDESLQIAWNFSISKV
jgi:hypothetical protein